MYFVCAGDDNNQGTQHAVHGGEDVRSDGRRASARHLHRRQLPVRARRECGDRHVRGQPARRPRASRDLPALHRDHAAGAQGGQVPGVLGEATGGAGSELRVAGQRRPAALHARLSGDGAAGPGARQGSPGVLGGGRRALPQHRGTQQRHRQQPNGLLPGLVRVRRDDRGCRVRVHGGGALRPGRRHEDGPDLVAEQDDAPTPQSRRLEQHPSAEVVANTSQCGPSAQPLSMLTVFCTFLLVLERLL